MNRSYQLSIVLEKQTVITVGKLGTFTFPAGRYVYSGSARRNIEARVARHMAKSKKMRWHIDYLLSHPESKLIRAELFAEGECELNQRTEGVIVAPGFGATDCRNRCKSHLKYFSI
jgi:Uri superfamily endonuclease